MECFKKEEQHAVHPIHPKGKRNITAFHPSLAQREKLVGVHCCVRQGEVSARGGAATGDSWVGSWKIRRDKFLFRLRPFFASLLVNLLLDALQKKNVVLLISVVPVSLECHP